MGKALVKREEMSPAQTEQMEDILSNIVLKGDISQLTQPEKVQYYNSLCQRIGLDPMTQPFEIVKFQGKEVLYARKGATEQLRALHGISVTAMTSQHLSDCFVVQVTVQNAKGRVDFGTGAVSIANKKGDDLANALMKAETKAKRRATLSICGLGMLDETEIETIPGAKPVIGELSELRGGPLPEALGKKIDDVLKNAAPPAPAKSPEPASGAGNGKPVEKDTRLVDWKNKAIEADPKNGEARFLKAFQTALEKRRVKSFSQLAKDAQDAVVGEVRMVVEAMLPMLEGKKRGKLAEKFDALAESQ